MDIIIPLILLVLLNILGFAMPALFAAWLLTLALPIALNQALWLSFGTIIIVTYMTQTLADIPGQVEFGLQYIFLSVVVAYITLTAAALAGYGLSFIPLDLTMFELLLLTTVSLIAGIFFMLRAGSGGLPRWMTMSMIMDLEEGFEEDDDDYIIQPPSKPRGRKSRRRRR